MSYVLKPIRRFDGDEGIPQWYWEDGEGRSGVPPDWVFFGRDDPRMVRVVDPNPMVEDAYWIVGYVRSFDLTAPIGENTRRVEGGWILLRERDGALLGVSYDANLYQLVSVGDDIRLLRVRPPEER